VERETRPWFLFQDGDEGRVFVIENRQNMNDDRYDESMFHLDFRPGTSCGRRPFRTKKCRYYEMKTTLPNGDKALLRGWIDDKTSQPVGWSEDWHAFAFFPFAAAPPPRGPLVLPPKIPKGNSNRFESFFSVSQNGQPGKQSLDPKRRVAMRERPAIENARCPG